MKLSKVPVGQRFYATLIPGKPVVLCRKVKPANYLKANYPNLWFILLEDLDDLNMTCDIREACVDMEVKLDLDLSKRTVVNLKNAGIGERKLIKDFYGSVWYTLKDKHILVDDSDFFDPNPDTSAPNVLEGTVRDHNFYIYGPITVVGGRNDG